MGAVNIIKNNQNELDAGDFTTLLTAITWDDPVEQMDLIKVLSMFKQAEVPPFNKYDAEGLRRLVLRSCEVLDPSKSTTGLLTTDKDYQDRWEPYREGLETLGISFH